MLLRLLRAKLHQATVTRSNVNYHGSITIDEDLMDAVGLLPFEQVVVGNCNNGRRGETYVLRGKRGSRAIELNGAMAHVGEPGERLIVMAFAFLKPKRAAVLKPRVAVLNERNEIIDQWTGDGPAAEDESP